MVPRRRELVPGFSCSVGFAVFLHSIFWKINGVSDLLVFFGKQINPNSIDQETGLWVQFID
jgi:hypothetical protein